MNKASASYSLLEYCLDKNISFAAYTLPGETKFTFIAQQGKATELRNIDEINKGFILHPFDKNSNSPILLIKDDLVIKEGETKDEFDNFLVNSRIINADTDFKPACADRSAPASPVNTSREEYKRSFKKCKQKLDNGHFQKLVLSRIKNIDLYDPFRIVDLFKKLNQHYPDSFNHISYTPQSGIWIGASPEILLKMNNKTGQGQTVALAGTQKKNQLATYKWEHKEIEEQKFVVDYIREMLQKQLSKEKLKISHETIQAGKMLHLRSNFSFPVKEIKNKIELINDLHPTPAVCGLPKNESLNFITQTEKHHRAYYSGFLGPINLEDETHLFVNLRCAYFAENRLSLFLGGGLTKDSVEENEWNETELKATTLQSLL